LEKVAEQELISNLQTGESTPQKSTSSNSLINGTTSTLRGREAVVIRVVDGDTVDVIFPDNSTARVRLIGIDTPETYSSNSPYEYEGITDTSCLSEWGGRASKFAKDKLEGKSITLVSEPNANTRDIYGRLLAYIHIEGEDINATMVQGGFARVYTEGQSSRMDEYLAEEMAAQSNSVGLWGCGSPGQQSKPPQSVETAFDCEPSYPTICLPPPPPGLNCSDVAHRRFEVLSPDPHRLDGDRDGVGCERSTLSVG